MVRTYTTLRLPFYTSMLLAAVSSLLDLITCTCTTISRLSSVARFLDYLEKFHCSEVLTAVRATCVCSTLSTSEYAEEEGGSEGIPSRHGGP